MKESRAAKAARLEEEGRAALSAGNFKRAVAIGIRLKKSSYAGYELHARGLWEMGYREDAFRVLQAGVKMAPTAPTLWALQGEWMGAAD